MKITLLDVHPLFGVESEAVVATATELGQRLAERGHNVDHVRLPFSPVSPQAIAEQMLGFRLLAAAAAQAEVTIAVRFPAYFVPARQPRLWLLDVADVAATGHEAWRQFVQSAERRQWAQAAAVFAPSAAAAQALERSHGLRVTGVLPPPDVGANEVAGWNDILDRLLAA